MRINKGIAQKIKKSVQLLDPGAWVILYGSRAKGRAQKESDWDILILVKRAKITLKDEQVFRHKLFDVELETARHIYLCIFPERLEHTHVRNAAL